MADLTDYEIGLAVIERNDPRLAHLTDPRDVERLGAALRPALTAAADSIAAMAEIADVLAREHPDLAQTIAEAGGSDD